MPIGLALLSALSIGAADFVGGRASRRASAIGVVTVAQLVDLIAFSVITMIGGAAPVARDLWIGMIAGAVGSLAFVAFLVALARGPMSLVSPFTAIFGVATPVTIGVLLGERPSTLLWVGVATGVIAIGLTSRPPEAPGAETARGSTLLIAAIAGVGFGLFVALLDATRPEAGLTPMIAGRAVGIVLLLVILVSVRHRLPTGAERVQALAMGVLETIAVATLIAALHRGPLVSIGVLSSLYPVATVLLAVVLLRERLDRIHRLGIGLAMVAVVLIAAG